METKEIKTRKEKLEADIYNLIVEFEKETDNVMEVSMIDIDAPPSYLKSDKGRAVKVKLEVTI